MQLILLGAPGAGKGTQAAVISDRLGIPAISTGNILREAIRQDTPLGRQAKGLMDAGQLVPDQVVLALVQERLAQPDCEKGFVLDGFPRNMAQAKALDELGVRIDRVISLEVSDEAITRRMCDRRVCSRCGASYHLQYQPSKEDGVCDKCGAPTVQREDDKPETVQERLAVYHVQTEPLKAYYAGQGKLCTVLGQEKVEDTTALTLRALEAQG